MSWIEKLKFDEKGLIPAVIQDYKNNEVLMVAYMNKAALEKTLAKGKTHFYSRSRGKLWLKGDTSGFYQTVKMIYVDCDMDCLLVKVWQEAGACHAGYRSCFYREDKKGTIEIVAEKGFDQEKAYKK